MLGIFLDSETNGLNYQRHKILEIAFQIVDMFSGDVKCKYQSIVYQTAEDFNKSDPESLKINGFTLKEVSSGKTTNQIRDEIIEIFNTYNIKRKKSVFICQNPSFDRVFFSQLVESQTQELLLWPYHWLDLASMHWARSLDAAQKSNTPFPWEIGFSKDSIASYYKLPPEEKPHRAMNGVDHLLKCYTAVVGFPKKD